jgi:hypothetical protein
LICFPGPDVGEAHLRLLHQVFYLTGQNETGVGYFADPATLLGAVDELDFDRAIRRDRDCLFFGRGIAGWLSLPKQLPVRSGASTSASICLVMKNLSGGPNVYTAGCPLSLLYAIYVAPTARGDQRTHDHADRGS